MHGQSAQCKYYCIQHNSMYKPLQSYHKYICNLLLHFNWFCVLFVVLKANMTPCLSSILFKLWCKCKVSLYSTHTSCISSFPVLMPLCQCLKPKLYISFYISVICSWSCDNPNNGANPCRFKLFGN